MISSQVVLVAHLVVKFFATKLASVHKGAPEVNTLDVVDSAVQLGKGFHAEGALDLLGQQVGGCVLAE